MSLLPTKLLTSWEDIGADHSDVPAWLRQQAFTFVRPLQDLGTQVGVWQTATKSVRISVSV